MVMQLHQYHSDRLRRIVQGRLGLSEYLRRKMLEALDLVDRGVHGSREIVRTIVRDLRPKKGEKRSSEIVLTPQNIGRRKNEE